MEKSEKIPESEDKKENPWINNSIKGMEMLLVALPGVVQPNKQIPQGWKEVKLSEVLDYEQPTEYIVNSEIIDEETPIPVLTANKGFIKGYTKEKEGICKNLPVIIFDDFTTDSKFVNFPFKVKSSAMKILKLKDKDAILKYIFYQMQTVNVRATTHKRYYLSEYQNLYFLFPINSKQKISFEKQQSIVSAIETQFTRLDDAVKNLKSVKEKLKIYRKAVLKKAFEGKVSVNLGKITNLITKGASPRWQGIEYTDNEEILFVTSENVRDGFLDITHPKYVELKFNEKQKKSILKTGDVLLNIVGASIGRATIYNLNKNANINQAVSIIRLIDNRYSKYVCYYLNSPVAKSYYNKEKVDVARANLSLVNVSNIPLPFCNFEEATKIVSTIESKFSVIDKVENIVEESLKKAEKLRKSILKSAFEGKLVREK